MISRLSAGMRVPAWRSRGLLAALGVAVVLMAAVLVFTLFDKSGSDAGSAQLALSQVVSAHLKLAKAETKFNRRSCKQPSDALECEIRAGTMLRRQLLVYAAAVQRVALPSATTKEIASRVERAAREAAALISEINMAKSISQYNSLGNSFNPMLSANYYELEDNATYLRYVLEGNS